MKLSIQVYVQVPAFGSFEYVLGIAESYDNSIFIFLRNCYTNKQMGLIVLF